MAPADNPADAELFAALSRWSGRTRGRRAVRLKVWFDDESDSMIRVPPCHGMQRVAQATSSVPESQSGDDTLNQLERAIVTVVDSLRPDETLTGEEVAERAGYPLNGRVKDALARLVRVGRIRNRRPGYAKM